MGVCVCEREFYQETMRAAKTARESAARIQNEKNSKNESK